MTHQFARKLGVSHDQGAVNNDHDTSPRGLVAEIRAFPAVFALRLLWLSLPFTVGATLGTALDDTARSIQIVASTGMWTAWVLGLTASLIRRPLSLTVVRVIGPAMLVAAIIAAVASDAHPLALAHAGALSIIVLLPEVGERFVDGLSYGDERRVLLRAPFPVLVGTLPLTWAITVCGIAAGPLALAAQKWILGALLIPIGLGLAYLSSRALHGLTRRWVIFVPSGLVIHDLMQTREPFLLRRMDVQSVGPLMAGDEVGSSGTIDVSQNALGIVLELKLSRQVEVVRLDRRIAEVQMIDRVLFSPSRPGATLAEAKRRKVVG